MAWLRTSLALMALGFVVDRFGLILQRARPESMTLLFPRAFSLWSGVGLVALGSLMALVATSRYMRFHSAYHREGTTRPQKGVLLGSFFSLVIAIFGIILAVFLLSALE